MMHLPASLRVYFCTAPGDMRRGLDGLHALVAVAMQLDAFGGESVRVSNHRRGLVKILFGDRNGLAVHATCSVALFQRRTASALSRRLTSMKRTGI